MGNRNIYKPFNPLYPMKKENKKLILQVKEAKTGQKRITIPKENEEFEHNDYVEVKKHE